MALCAFPGCDHPEGSVCTMAGCPGRKFKSQATPCGFGGDHFATVPAEPFNDPRCENADALASAKSVSFHAGDNGRA